jgi:NADPH2 dehydrogenase
LVSLIDPLKVKGVTLKDRIVMPPMGTEYATAKGEVTEKLIEYYTRRSPIVGLVIIEHSYIAPEGKVSPNQLGIYKDDLIHGLKQLASKIRATGTPVVIQINHGGKVASQEITGTMPVAPSADGKARELKIQEIEALTETFASAAERAMQAGFDGVELHGAHGFLLNQFYSPLTNRREDKYGKSLVKRIKFPLEAVKRVKQTVGEKLLMYRIGSDDMDPAGTKIGDSQKFAVKLEKAGVDVIDVSGGLCGSRPADLQETQGFFIPQAQQIKKAVHVPVIGVGGITKPEYADKVIREGQVDLVAVGRALVKDPEWPKKAIMALRRS